MLTNYDRLRMYDPDDPGGAGDEPPPTVKDTGADLKAVADTIRQAIEAGRVSQAPAPAPMSFAPSGPSDATRRALEEEGAQVNTKFDELFNAGRGSEAMAMREAFVQKANRTLSTTDPADSPIVRTAVALGERAARTEHKDVMTRWPDEVKRAVDALPLEERVLPDAWDKAVSRVKSNHFDEILNEQVTMKVDEAKRQFVPPPNTPGSRGARRLEGAAAKLSEEQLWAVDLCGVTAEDYAKQITREEAYDALPFKQRGPFPGYPVLGNVVEKGGF